MSDLIFFVKTLVLTIVLVLVMQIEVGSRSIESHAMGWIHTSSVVTPLKDAAKGAAKLLRDFYDNAKKEIKNPFQ